MALTGYPQTHHSPDILALVTADEHDDTQYLGPFSKLKVMSDATSEYAVLWIYLDKAGYDSNTTEGTDFYKIHVMATDAIPGPIYGFRFHTDSSAGASVIAYRYSTSIL